MISRDYTGEVCAAADEVDHALAKLAAAPHDLEECQKHLVSAVWHLSEAVRSPGVPASQSAQRAVDDLQKKMRRLNTLFRNAHSFYRGWASLAGVTDGDCRRGSLSMHG